MKIVQVIKEFFQKILNIKSKETDTTSANLEETKTTETFEKHVNIKEEKDTSVEQETKDSSLLKNIEDERDITTERQQEPEVLQVQKVELKQSSKISEESSVKVEKPKEIKEDGFQLKRLLGNGDKFVVIDLETTGVLNEDKIVEIAMITIDQNGDIQEEWSSLVRAELKSQHKQALQLNKIDAKMLIKAPTFEELAPLIAKKLNRAVLVAYNAHFDIRFLKNHFERLQGINIDFGNAIDTKPPKNKKLVQVCAEFDLEFDSGNAHLALTDARGCSNILLFCPPYLKVGAPVEVKTMNLDYKEVNRSIK